jgi:VWFA-related protein
MCLLVALPARAQAPGPSVTFSTRTELVLVPVIVHHDNAHVPGLKKEDFVVSENGVEQKIATFEEIRPSTAPVAPLPKANVEVFTNSRPANFAPRRINIVLLDTVNTDPLDQTSARRALMKLLEQTVTSNDLTTVLLLTQGGVRVVYDFTTDRAVLSKALDMVKSRATVMSGLNTSATYTTPNAEPMTTQGDFAAAMTAEGIEQLRAEMESVQVRQQQEVAIQTTLDAFRAIARAYSGIPGRKSLVWLTGGFPFLVAQVGEAVGSRTFEVDFTRVFNELNAANIAFYPIDARGLVTTGQSVAGSPRPIVTSRRMPRMETALNDQRNDTFSTMFTFANMTGGRAFTNTNDLNQAIASADNDSGSYYQLGYYTRHDGAKPGWRKLAVKVKRSGVQVRARTGYFVVKETPESAEQVRIRDIAGALNSPFESASYHISVRWTGQLPSDDSGKKTVKFSVMLDKDSVTLDDTDANHLDVDILAVAHDAGMNVVGRVAQKLQGHLAVDYAKKILATGLQYPNQFVLAPGHYVVRFVVRDNITGRTGSLDAPITVN